MVSPLHKLFSVWEPHHTNAVVSYNDPRCGIAKSGVPGEGGGSFVVVARAKVRSAANRMSGATVAPDCGGCRQLSLYGGKIEFVERECVAGPGVSCVRLGGGPQGGIVEGQYLYRGRGESTLAGRSILPLQRPGEGRAVNHHHGPVQPVGLSLGHLSGGVCHGGT